MNDREKAILKLVTAIKIAGDTVAASGRNVSDGIDQSIIALGVLGVSPAEIDAALDAIERRLNAAGN